MIEPDITTRFKSQGKFTSRAVYKFIYKQFSGQKVNRQVAEQTESYPVRTSLESAQMAVNFSLKNFDHPGDSSPPERFQNG